MLNPFTRSWGADQLHKLGAPAFAFLIIFVLAIRPALAQSGRQQEQNVPESSQAARVRALNNSLLQLHGEMQGSPSEATAIRSEAPIVIAQRAAALKALIEDNPRVALSFAFSPELLADLATKFPTSASSLESHTTVSGPVEHWIADYPNKTSRSQYVMKIGQQRLNLYFAAVEPGNPKSGEVLQVTGVAIGSTMAVEKSSMISSTGVSTSTLASRSFLSATQFLRQPSRAESFSLLWLALLTALVFKADILRKRRHIRRVVVYVIALAFLSNSAVASAQSCSTTGVQNVAVLLVTFPGVALPATVTPQSLDDVFFNTSTGVSLDGYLREASYGQTSATGSVFGPYTLTGTYSSCGVGTVLNDAIAAAVSSGVNLAGYNRIFLVFPDTLGCGWAGFAASGCSIATANGTFNASVAYTAAYYVANRSGGVSLVAHEMGHNLGLLHSGTISSGTDVLGPIASPGSETDMGDYWATMGEMVLGLYTAPQKSETLGWLAPASNYETVQSSGTYTLQPLETSPAGLEALKVQRGTGNNEWLWIEYRQPLGNYDSTLLTQPFSGALIHYEDSSTTSGHTYLPNFTPTDTSGNSPALAAGQAWIDPYSNLSISVLSATSTGLTVSVNYGATPCISSAPSVAVSPLNPSIYPGQSASYSLSVTNNDSSACSSSAISLGSSEPSGWSTSLSSSSVTLSPGQSASVTMGKGAPIGTPPGTYAVNMSASKNSLAASGTANATVMAPPSFMASLSIAGASFSVPGTASITASVTNGGVPTSGASVTFTLTTPSGGSATQTSTTGSNGSAIWNYKLNSRSSAGTYSVSAQAALSSGSKKAASTQTASSNTATFIVQ